MMYNKYDECNKKSDEGMTRDINEELYYTIPNIKAEKIHLQNEEESHSLPHALIYVI